MKIEKMFDLAKVGIETIKNDGFSKFTDKLVNFIIKKNHSKIFRKILLNTTTIQK